jgi:hypothetical protein
MVNITPLQTLRCRALLATFFSDIKTIRARWYPIIFSEDERNSTSNIDPLSTLLGINYDAMYLPFMKECGLVMMCSVINRSTSEKVVVDAPCITTGCSNKIGYTWDDFFLHYDLPSFMEISFLWINKRKRYFLRVGEFDDYKFTVGEQIKGFAGRHKRYVCKREAQRVLVRSLAHTSLQLTSHSPDSVTDADNREDYSAEDSTSMSASHNSFEFVHDDSNVFILNLKNILQVHLFDRVLKPGADCTHIWSMIDASKLQDGINGFVEAMKKEKEKKYIEGFKAAGIYNVTAEIQVNDGRTIDDFPAFKFYGVPLLTTSIHSILRDIVSLSERTASKILNFPLFNCSDVTCSLVNIPGSISYDRFKRNVKRKSWVDQLLVAASMSREKEESARWMLMHLGEHYNDIFADIACKLGLVLSGKVMDAELAWAMWEEANVALHPQRIILRHLASFFGRRITVPEREIRELEQGTLSPIVDMAVINGEDINFWYKNVDEVISHRILIELKGRGRFFF